jgi:tetrathionate reductase subunit B
MANKTFVVDAAKCSNCSLCIIACKDEHVGHGYSPWTKPQPDTGQFWIDVQTTESGRAPRVKVSQLPLFCQHCGNAACVKACPDNAIKRRADGLVWIDPASCTGCGLCESACPYDVIYMNKELNIAQKCTGCAHRVDEGLPPRCVEICPHNAIAFGDDTSAPFNEIGRGGAFEVYHPEYQAEPRVYWRNLPKPWIAGTIIDAARDEVIPEATITSVDLVQNDVVTVQSDAFGDFCIKGVAPDRKYRIEIKKDGYEKSLAIVTIDGAQDLGEVSLKRQR